MVRGSGRMTPLIGCETTMSVWRELRTSMVKPPTVKRSPDFTTRVFSGGTPYERAKFTVFCEPTTSAPVRWAMRPTSST